MRFSYKTLVGVWGVLSISLALHGSWKSSGAQKTADTSATRSVKSTQSTPATVHQRLCFLHSAMQYKKYGIL